GGGTDWAWLDHCAQFNYRLDASGNLIIPTMPLAPGGPLLKSAPAGTYPWRATGGYTADSYDAAALYSIHIYNMARPDPRDWRGFYKRVPAAGATMTYHYGTLSYVNAAGSVVARTGSPSSTWSIHTNAWTSSHAH